MDNFVANDSIVRQIWGKSDTVLFIFAGAAAEFALNKAVDWLFFTGKLPADPIGRLFSTVAYARNIIFSSRPKSHAVIDGMASIHKQVEEKRNASIPQWSYRDVLYMLVDYSIRSFEILDRNLTMEEKEEVFDVFMMVGKRMKIETLPLTFEEWITSREEHLNNDMIRSDFTIQMFAHYKQHLGWLRYQVLLSTQAILVPTQVKRYLGLKRSWLMNVIIRCYKAARLLGFGWHVKKLILPAKYIQQIKAIDQ